MENTAYSLIDNDCIPERDTEVDFSEWFEDAASDMDWADNISINPDSPSPSDIEEPNLPCCLLEDLYEKNKILERQWKDTQQKYQNLLLENQKLNIQLSNERHRASKYHKKLQYIQENYEIFSRLKQAYLNMKYNQTSGRPMVEIRDRASQTWQGIICASCIETAEAKRQAELAKLCSFTGSEPELVTIKRCDLSKMQGTLQQLKEKIDQRELSWSYNEDREVRYKIRISELQNTVRVLNEIISQRHDEGEYSRSLDNSLDVLQKENGLLGKIIVKLEKRLRDMEKMYKPEKRLPLLNAQEKNLIQLLTKRYTQKLQQKLRQKLACGSTVTSIPIQNPMLALPHSSQMEMPNNGFIAQNGGGEGSSATVFDVPFSHPHPSIDYKEEAEKPMSPKKKEAPAQIDLIDFSEETIHN